ncbi:unnamed protein product [Ostreobium quekettii]|uniref:Metalloenzyme domain-containing protein n=1 Tax=Ostreobium quekettii TaxID=121088 RepID=A0A8S1JG49_9CHLO|nr:unnamed protein product [Ostreobium quekettii]
MPLGKARLPKGKVIFVMIDGVGDVSVAQLHGLTPLEAAKTPYLDALAASGFTGLLDPVEPGLACGSDTAHMSIFGYEPRRLYRGRGALESMGAGLEMSPGDIAFKCNFACLNKDTGIVERRRADRNFESIGPQLCADLNGIKLPSFPCHEICVKYATEHRCGLVVHGCGLTDAITGTDPLKDNLPLLQSAPTDGSKEDRIIWFEPRPSARLRRQSLRWWLCRSGRVYSSTGK